ncbi:MAG: cyclic nucleotide-binding domain-containing protein, partial [Planctomycetales bacterium]
MNHHAYGTTDQGRRHRANEDAIRLDDELGVYLVCDGLGGHAGGEVASRLTADTTLETIRRYQHVLTDLVALPSPRNRAAVVRLIERSVEEACSVVNYQAESDSENLGGMASTIVLMTMLGQHAVVSHVGDSRAYLLRRGRVYQITSDHSLLAERRRWGAIASHMERSEPADSVILRAIGFQESVQVDCLHFELLPGDVYLLCSDGLSDYMHEGKEFRDLVEKHPLEEVPDQLIAWANECGGKDNISAVVIQVDGVPDPDAFDAFDKMELLRSTPVFSRLTCKELMFVLNVVYVKRCKAGDVIIEDGAEGKEMFISVEGTFEVRKDGRRLSELPAGAFFGEMALLGGSVRTAEIVAVSPGKLLVMSQEA